jgi:hypothetical protein
MMKTWNEYLRTMNENTSNELFSLLQDDDIQVIRDWLTDHNDPLALMFDTMFASKERRTPRKSTEHRYRPTVVVKMPRGSMQQIHNSFAENLLNFDPKTPENCRFLDGDKFYQGGILGMHVHLYKVIEISKPHLPLIINALQGWVLANWRNGYQLLDSIGINALMMPLAGKRVEDLSEQMKFQLARYLAYCRIHVYRWKGK